MKCQSCGKKEATVKYHENINGNKQTLYFCVDCAKKIGFSDFSDFSTFPGFSNLSNFFAPIFSVMPEYNLLEQKQCPVCGYTIEDYSNTGMLGCEECYKTFEENLDDLFYKINGKNRHIKIEKSKTSNTINRNSKKDNKDSALESNNDKEISKLKKELEKLIKEEKYEEAAIIRDKIKGLNKDR